MNEASALLCRDGRENQEWEKKILLSMDVFISSFYSLLQGKKGFLSVFILTIPRWMLEGMKEGKAMNERKNKHFHLISPRCSWESTKTHHIIILSRILSAIISSINSFHFALSSALLASSLSHYHRTMRIFSYPTPMMI